MFGGIHTCSRHLPIAHTKLQLALECRPSSWILLFEPRLSPVAHIVVEEVYLRQVGQVSTFADRSCRHGGIIGAAFGDVHTSSGYKGRSVLVFW
jgi:hypothetical protein